MIDPTTPRDRRVMKLREEPWHRRLDPGTDQTGGGGIQTGHPGVLDDLALVVEARGLLQEGEEGAETLHAACDLAIAIIRRASPLIPDRAGSNDGDEPVRVEY